MGTKPAQRWRRAVPVAVAAALLVTLAFGGKVVSRSWRARTVLDRLQGGELGCPWLKYKRGDLGRRDLDSVMTALSDPGSDSRRRIHAAEILAWEAEPRHAPIILSTAKHDSDPEVRRWAWLALAGCVRRTGVHVEVSGDSREEEPTARWGMLVARAALRQPAAANEMRSILAASTGWGYFDMIDACLAEDIARRDRGFQSWKTRFLEDPRRYTCSGMVRAIYLTAEEKLDLLDWVLSRRTSGDASEYARIVRGHLLKYMGK